MGPKKFRNFEKKIIGVKRVLELKRVNPQKYFLAIVEKNLEIFLWPWPPLLQSNV